MLFSSGQKLYSDSYQIIKQIARGGFGITYLAEDSKGNQIVIKTLNENAQNSPDVKQLKVSFFLITFNSLWRLIPASKIMS